MAELSDADGILIDQLLARDPDGWPTLIDRYQGRLLAFARSRLGRRPESEDLVQDTFVSFLTSIDRFDRQYSLETYLFTILRRKIIDFLRGAHLRVCSLQETLEQESGRAIELAGGLDGASWYAKDNEGTERLANVLSNALDSVVSRMKQGENLRDLRILEMLFYAQLRNKNAADELGITERQVAGVKFRALNELREAVAEQLLPPSGQVGSDAPSGGGLGGGNADMTELDLSALEKADSLLTTVWEKLRPTCPKRSVIGKFVLGTLKEPWKDFVAYHVQRLGCRLCRANYDDLIAATTDPTPAKQREEKAMFDRIMQSTIGFYKQ